MKKSQNRFWIREHSGILLEKNILRFYISSIEISKLYKQ